MEVVPSERAALDPSVALWLASLGERGITVASPGTASGGRGRLRVDVRTAGFVKPFTGVSGEYFLTALEGCVFQCAYCYLRGYLTSLTPTYYANRTVLSRELESLGREVGQQPVRVHGAHLGEVVPLEGVTGLIAFTADCLEPFPSVTLEVRTKSDWVEDMATLANRTNVVFSWTLAGDGQAQAFEGDAPSPAARVEALARSGRAGARVAVRLDPVIPLPGWEGDYAQLLDQVLATGVPLEDVHLGIFRFPAGVRPHFEATVRGRSLLRGELLAGPDGKVRLSAPARFRVLRKLVAMVRARFAPMTPIQLCMEPPWFVKEVLAP